MSFVRNIGNVPITIDGLVIGPSQSWNIEDTVITGSVQREISFYGNLGMIVVGRSLPEDYIPTELPSPSISSDPVRDIPSGPPIGGPSTRKLSP